MPSLSVSSNCDEIILPTKHILHIFLQCLSFTVACLKSSLWTIYSSHEVFFCLPDLAKDRLFSFLISIHRFWLVFRFALCGVLQQLYIDCFCVFGSFHPFCWSYQFRIQSDAICTILAKGLPTHSNAITSKFLGCWIPSMIFVRARLGSQMFALNLIQHAGHFRPCKHLVPTDNVFLSNLLCLRHL